MTTPRRQKPPARRTAPSGRPAPAPIGRPAAGAPSGPAVGGRGAARRRPPVRQQSFVRRNRTALLAIGGIVVLAFLGWLAFLNFTSPAYACSSIWTPAPTAAPAPGATPRLGYVQDDQGREHVAAGTTVRYTFCPPASGKHYNTAGFGPIKPAVYGPDDRAVPESWIHNLEHGGLVVLYRCQAATASGAPAPSGSAGDGCTDAVQQAMKQLFADWPPSPVCAIPPHLIAPVFARFDDMAWPYAAIVWDEVLPLETFDRDAILAFFAQQGERTNPEQQCAAPTASPGPTAAPTAVPSASASAAASGAAAESASPAASATPAPSPS